jgi:Na+-driven multidrug efflux pump
VKSTAPQLLSAPIVPTLARLSAPGILLVAFQSMVSVGDTYFVGRLGTAPLAGLALVFPLVMLLQMTSAGARCWKPAPPTCAAWRRSTPCSPPA